MAILNWADAPEWATHIVRAVDIPDIECWALKAGDNYYNETWRESLLASFDMGDEGAGEPAYWEVASARPSLDTMEVQ
ncbi:MULTISPECIES: hypothetical protein [Pseudomonas]|uniref:hypothetical protein n=1 Tax=Pseudomonas TaxID=286 RepID=UPI002248ED37|nr:hypothetical protein [Pseudomonas sp. DCB_BG]MCX2706079.1 hypothetical protein [Pseudomonas sp. DCB_BG]